MVKQCIDAQQNNAGVMGVEANRTGREIEGVRGRGKLLYTKATFLAITWKLSMPRANA